MKSTYKVTINGQEMTAKEASRLKGACSYPALIKRLKSKNWQDMSFEEIVFTAMMPKSAIGKRSASRGAFGGNRKYQNEH